MRITKQTKKMLALLRFKKNKALIKKVLYTANFFSNSFKDPSYRKSKVSYILYDRDVWVKQIL